jgi:hypothetical protein
LLQRLDYRLGERETSGFLLSVRKNHFLLIVERGYYVHPPVATGVAVQGLKTSGGKVAVPAVIYGAVDV